MTDRGRDTGLARDAVLHTTLGPRRREDLGLILPHEHIVVDIRPPDAPGFGEATAEDVTALMAPRLDDAVARGVTALVDCATGGVGRRVDLVLAVSQAAGLPVVVATGIYREPWIPGWARGADDDELSRVFAADLAGGIDGTDVVAAWVKLSAGDDGITPTEERILRAAARAAAPVEALIGSHTRRGRVVLDQLRILTEEGFPLDRFLWIHTQLEADEGLHREVAGRGCWIEYDDLGWGPVDTSVALIGRALDDGLAPRLLLSHDAGWYHPGEPGGGTPQPWTALTDEVLPELRRRGVDRATLDLVTRDNPFLAFAR